MLNNGVIFSKFIRNVMIVDDAIRADKKTKKRKVVAAPSGSVPLKYRTVYHHGSTYPPRQPQYHQHQHQRQPQQWGKEHFVLGIYKKTHVHHLSERMVYYSRFATGKSSVALGVS
jgi:hypothetical protein